MEKKTLHRVIGTMVVIGVAIILFPLFQTPTEAPGQITIAQEIPPPFPKQDIPEDTIVPAEVISPATATSTVVISTVPTTSSATIPTNNLESLPTIAKGGSPLPKVKIVSHVKKTTQVQAIAWAVQMGSFKNKIDAIKLTNQLRANGYKAFTKQVTSALGTNTHVYVGPTLKKEEAHSLAIKLKQDTRIQGIVVPYKPLDL